MNIFTHGKKRARMTSSPTLPDTKRRAKNPQDSTRGLRDSLRQWYHQRPCWGAFCVLLAGLLILWAPLCLLQNAIIPASTQWAGLTIGGLLLAMGLIELFAPSHALVAGTVGVVLSLVSLITVLGGFGIGMLLGVIGSSYAVAWKPERKTGSRPVFWSVLGCSLVTACGIVMLATRGVLAVAAPMVVPYTSTVGRSECHNTRTTHAISRVDHRTPVILAHSDYCITSNVVITQKVLGRTITVTSAANKPTMSRGVTSEIVASQTNLSETSNATLSGTNGLQQEVEVSIGTNVTSQVLFSHVESATTHDVAIRISLS